MKIVIFDMDGTLLDTKKDITISINHIRNLHYNLPPLSEDFIINAINMHDRNLPKLFYGTQSYEEKDKEVFGLHYAQQCTQNTYIYNGIVETLKKLVEHKIKISVATNAPTKFANIMLKHLNIYDLFDLIIGSDKVKISKPHPQMLYKILNHYNYDKTKDIAWMIGDNSKDIQSAKNANINSMFATWGFSPKSQHKITLKEPKEILDIVL